MCHSAPLHQEGNGAPREVSRHTTESVKDQLKGEEMGGVAGLNLGSTSTSSASNFARTYGSQASQRSEAAAATANDINQKTMQTIMNFNHEEALLQREWEEAMSNTAYQRAIADMKSAGINPILSALNGGASTPSGASATGSALSAAMANTYADSVSGGSSKSESVDNFANGLLSLGNAIRGLGSFGETFKGLFGDKESGKTVDETIGTLTEMAGDGFSKYYNTIKNVLSGNNSANKYQQSLIEMELEEAEEQYYITGEYHFPFFNR